jgi:hypothetical protein
VPKGMIFEFLFNIRKMYAKQKKKKYEGRHIFPKTGKKAFQFLGIEKEGHQREIDFNDVILKGETRKAVFFQQAI